MIYAPKTNSSTIVNSNVNSGSVVSPSPMSVSLTPPVGKRVKLTGLSTNGVENTGLTISVGDVVVYMGSFSNGNDGSFTVGSNTSYTGTIPPYRQIECIEGGVDESITLVSAPINTKAHYSYEFGE